MGVGGRDFTGGCHLLSQFCGKCPIGVAHTAETFIDNIVLKLPMADQQCCVMLAYS